MTTEFHIWLYGRFIEIQSNLRREKKTSQPQSNSVKKVKPTIKLDDFFQHWNQQATSCPIPQCLVDQIQIQTPILIIATNQMPDYTYNRE